MKEFSTIVAQQWNVAEDVALEICTCFQSGDSFFQVNDYNALVSAHVDLTTLSEIYAFLQQTADLAPKKKRVTNALAKAGSLNDELENRIRLCTSSSELDDMLLPIRPNPRSRGQLAAKKGLDDLVAIFLAQELEEGSVEDLAGGYVGKEASLKSLEDVLANVKDILIERFAYDETVRSMVREFGYDDGFFEIIPRNKKDKDFAKYRGKMIPVVDLTPEQTLEFIIADQDKQIRFKHGVQLFRITELLRHHFINNPDFIGFDLLCEVIDECWTRFLEPITERYVRDRVHKSAEDWAIVKVAKELEKLTVEGKDNVTFFTVGITAEKDIVVVALSGEGNLLGATKEKMKRIEKDFLSKRLQQFSARFKPNRIIVHANEFGTIAEGIITKSLEPLPEGVPLVAVAAGPGVQKLVASDWMKQKFADLDADMQLLYALGIVHQQPLALIPQIGVQYFELHPLQNYISANRIGDVIARKITERKLRKGIPLMDVPDSVLVQLGVAPDGVLQEVRKQAAKGLINSKLDLLNAEGMNERIFRNIAGYIVCPTSDDLLDRTTVHPIHFEWVYAMSQQLNISMETLLSNPEQLRELKDSDFVKSMFLEQRLIPQLLVGQGFTAVAAAKPRRRLLLSEIEEGAIMPGRVTNITPFGVFVDINATCDGLVHISHLADSFVETADQVVKINDRVDVRVLKVDKKKKRISLSMKGLGDRGPKIRPSRDQLSNLADFFKNR
jgi:uncharacterized protein